MASYLERIEGFAGTQSDFDLVSSWLTDGARRLIDHFPPEKLAQYGQKVAVASLTDPARIYLVEREGRNARQIAVTMASQAADASSLYYATIYDPAYYFSNGTLTLLPNTGNWYAHVVYYPTVTYTASEIPSFPPSYDEMVMQYATIEALNHNLKTEFALLPSPASSPSFSYTPATASSISTNAAFTIDLSTEFAAVLTYIATDEDIELAKGKLEEISVKLAEFERESRLELERVVANAKMAQDVETFNAAQQIQTDIQTYIQTLSGFQTEIARSAAAIGVIQAQLASMRSQYADSLYLAFGVGQKKGDKNDS